MRENGLLNNRNRYKRLSPRLWVKDIVPKPTQSFEYLEVDIKYIWIAGQRRHALLLTVLDVESRWVLGQYMDWKIRKEHVIELFDRIFSKYKFPKRIFVRNDNGSQFEATMVRLYFEDKNVVQEFTKPATPEQNAHIEAYHSIIESVICRRTFFENLKQAQQTFNRFVEFYNFERIHSGIKYLWPKKYLDQKKIYIKRSKQNIEFLKCDFFNLISKIV